MLSKSEIETKKNYFIVILIEMTLLIELIDLSGVQKVSGLGFIMYMNGRSPWNIR